MVQQLKYGLYLSRKYSVCAEIPCQGSANRTGANQGAPSRWKPPVCWGGVTLAKQAWLLELCRKVTLAGLPSRPELQGNIAWTLLSSDMQCPTLLWCAHILWANCVSYLGCWGISAWFGSSVVPSWARHWEGLSWKSWCPCLPPCWAEAAKNSQVMLKLSPGPQCHHRKQLRFLVW